ncbi:hypothetical protein [Thermasporomyces composti]|jgi:hypothetical protein|nr:hypothetical protein [Thermasporomyces composti]
MLKEGTDGPGRCRITEPDGDASDALAGAELGSGNLADEEDLRVAA